MSQLDKLVYALHVGLMAERMQVAAFRPCVFGARTADRW